MKKILILLIVLLLISGMSCFAEENECPFKLTVVSKNNLIGPGNPFKVMLHNNSSETQVICDPFGHLGYYNLYFRIVIDNYDYTIRKTSAAWTANLPDPGIQVRPGDDYVFDVDIFVSAGWEMSDIPKIKMPEPVTITAVYENTNVHTETSLDGLIKSKQIWTGRVESEPIKVKFSNPGSGLRMKN